MKIKMFTKVKSTLLFQNVAFIIDISGHFLGTSISSRSLSFKTFVTALWSTQRRIRAVPAVHIGMDLVLSTFLSRFMMDLLDSVKSCWLYMPSSASNKSCQPPPIRLQVFICGKLSTLSEVSVDGTMTRWLEVYFSPIATSWLLIPYFFPIEIVFKYSTWLLKPWPPMAYILSQCVPFLVLFNTLVPRDTTTATFTITDWCKLEKRETVRGLVTKRQKFNKHEYDVLKPWI